MVPLIILEKALVNAGSHFREASIVFGVSLAAFRYSF